MDGGKQVCESGSVFPSGFSSNEYTPLRVQSVFQPFHDLPSKNFTARWATGRWGGGFPFCEILCPMLIQSCFCFSFDRHSFTWNRKTNQGFQYFSWDFLRSQRFSLFFLGFSSPHRWSLSLGNCSSSPPLPQTPTSTHPRTSSSPACLFLTSVSPLPPSLRCWSTSRHRAKSLPMQGASHRSFILFYSFWTFRQFTPDHEGQ